MLLRQSSATPACPRPQRSGCADRAHHSGSASSQTPRSRPRQEVHVRRGGAPAPQAAPGRRVPPLLQVRVRRGRGRPHHRPRPRARRPLLGQPVRHALQPHPGVRPHPRQPPGRGRRGRPAGQHAPPSPSTPRSTPPGPTSSPPPTRTRCTARRGRRSAACSTRSPRTRAPSTTTTRCSTTTPASSSTRGGQAHRPRPRRRQGRHPPQPRPAHRRPLASTRRPGGSSPWSAPARPSCWPRRPARRCSIDDEMAALDRHPGRQPPRRLVQLPAALRPDRRGSSPTCSTDRPPACA